MTFTLFNSEYSIVYEGKNLKEVKPLDEETYSPGGFTALLDAIGATLSKAKNRIDQLPVNRKPESVIVAILTDGQENYSREYKKEQINKLICLSAINTFGLI